MALPNGELQITPLNPQHAYPVDKRMQADTLNSRDSISPYIRWRGMQVHVLENDTTYMLKGGVTNEFWTVLGEGSGGGGSTFVGQVGTVDLLPLTATTGDYAYVGDGENFLQYNWDNIAGKWVSNTTNLSPEKFYTATVANGPVLEKVVFTKTLKDEVIEEDGAQVIYPSSMKNFIFTGSGVVLEGVGYADEENEFSVENRTDGTLSIITNGGVANTEFTSSTTIPVGGTKAFKGNGTTWDEVPVNEVGFSDSLNSFNAVKSIGPDGLELISGIYDAETGENVSFKEFTESTPVTDGVIFVLYGGKYYRRQFSSAFNVKWWGAKGDGVTDDTTAIQIALNAITANGGGNLYFPKSTGAYQVSSTLTNFNRITLSGDGPEMSFIKSNITGNGNLIDAFRDMNLRASFHIRDLTFTGAGTTDGYAINCTWFSNMSITRCYFDDFGAGAFTTTGTSNVTIQDSYIRACGSNTFFDSQNIGAIHFDQVDNFNNTLNLLNVYVSNCSEICGVYASAHSVRIVNTIIESCDTLLKIGSNFAHPYRSANYSIFGLYFENPRRIALDIEQCRNVVLSGLFVGGNIYTQDTPINITESTNITFQNCDFEFVGWTVDKYSQKIKFINCHGEIPELGISGFNDPDYIDEPRKFKGSFRDTHNWITNSDDLTTWIKTGTPTVTALNDFIDGYPSYEVTKTVSTHSILQHATRDFIVGEEVVGSIYVKGESQIRLMGRRTSDNVTEELSRAENIGPEWRRLYVSSTVATAYNRLSLYITPGTYSANPGTAQFAKGSIEVGRLTPGPHVKTNGLSIENDASGVINGDVILNSNILGYADAPPTTGKYNIGDRYFNRVPSNGISFWECTATGTPGTWEPSYRLGNNNYFNPEYYFAESQVDSYDLNTLTDGFVKRSSGTTTFVNSPHSGYWIVRDIASGSNNLHVQTAWLLSSVEVWVRTYYSSAWSSWVRIDTPDATTSVKGKLQLATQSEHDAGIDSLKAITSSLLHRSGTTANRPAGTKKTGLTYFDTDLGVLMVWNGTVWVETDMRNTDHPVSEQNYVFPAFSKDMYMRFTGIAGNLTVNSGVFSLNDEIIGHVQGGDKTIVAGSGVTLHMNANTSNVVKTGQQFKIKFISGTDAYLFVESTDQISTKGSTLLNGDGGNLTGTLNMGAITYLSVVAGTGFPTANGQLRTYNGSTSDRTFSLFKDRDTSDLYIQSYNSSNVGQGWSKLGSSSYINLTDTTDTTYTNKAFFVPTVSSFETGITLENPALLTPVSTIVDDLGSAWSASSIGAATKMIRIIDAGGGSLAGATGLQFKKLTIVNESASSFTLLHEDAGTTAANRFNFADSNDLVLPANSWVDLVYVNDRYRRGL